MFLLPLIAVLALAADAGALDFSQSNWIWTNDSSAVSGSTTLGGARAFRRYIAPHTGKIARFADIIVTADENFTFYVNGGEVGSGEYYPLAYAFRTPLLPSVSNLFAFSANSSSGSSPGLLVAIQVTYEDGSTDPNVVVSDATWRGFAGTPNGFQNPTFDDSSWPLAVIQSPYNASGWGPVTVPENPQTFVYTNATNWIWTSEAANPSVSAPVGSRPFRFTWTPPAGQVATSVTALIQVDDEYMLFVNGVMVSGGYNWGTSQQFAFALEPAPDVVFAVNATNYSGPAGFIAEIQITTAGHAAAAGECAECSSSKSFVITDQRWKWTTTIPERFEEPGFDDSSWLPAMMEVAYTVAFSPPSQ